MITYGMQKETAASIDVATKQAVNSVKKNLIVLQKAAAEYERSCVAYFKQVLTATGLSQKVVNKETGKVGKIRIVHGRYHSLEYPMELRFFQTMKNQRRSRTSCNSMKMVDRFLHHISYVCNRTTNSQNI